MFEKEAEENLVEQLGFDKEFIEQEVNKLKNPNEKFMVDSLIREVKYAFQKGAEFGYNKAKVEVEESYKESLCNSELNLASVTEQLEELEKANEWHYVKDGLPKKQYDKVTVTVAYLNAFKNPCKRDCFFDGKDFVYWDSGKNAGWKNVNIFGVIYAWKYADDFIPELPKESE